MKWFSLHLRTVSEKNNGIQAYLFSSPKRLKKMPSYDRLSIIFVMPDRALPAHGRKSFALFFCQHAYAGGANRMKSPLMEASA